MAPADTIATHHIHESTGNESTMASKLRRLTKARRQEIKRLNIHLRARHYLHRLERSTPFTVYSFTIEDEARRRAPQHLKKKKWILERRFSEFHDLKKKLLSLIKLWVDAHDAEQKKSAGFMNLLTSLRQPLEHRFPRKHLRCDSDSIVRERCLGLHNFVSSLFEVYADIYVHLYALKREIELVENKGFVAPRSLNGGDRDVSPEYKILWGIYLDIASFLNVPKHRKEAEYRHAASVLALEDCRVVKSTCASAKELACTGGGDYGCCICFDDGGYDDTSEEEDMASNVSGSSPHSEQVKENMFVQLPCGHQFHEDCVIPWLCTSVTCPLCRQAVTN